MKFRAAAAVISFLEVHLNILYEFYSWQLIYMITIDKILLFFICIATLLFFSNFNALLHLSNCFSASCLAKWATWVSWDWLDKGFELLLNREWLNVIDELLVGPIIFLSIICNPRNAFALHVQWTCWPGEKILQVV